MHIFLDEDCTVGVELLSSKEPVMRVSLQMASSVAFCMLELQPEKPDFINHVVSRIDGKLFM